MMEEYYKKIYIHSEDDLPKERARYIFGWDKTDTSVNLGISMITHSPLDDEETKAELIENYDWYLLPIESLESSQVERKSDDETIHYSIPLNVSQLLIADEEIEKSIPYPNPVSVHQHNQNVGWIRALKAMRDGLIKETEKKL
jgi:hypothetical protein